MKTSQEILKEHASAVISATEAHIKAYQNKEIREGRVYSNETTTINTATRAAKSFRRYIVEG